MLRLVNSLLLFIFVLLVSISVTQAQMPGDVNEDSLVDIGDVVYEINYLFRHGAYPLCLDCADPNATCSIEVGDVVYLINYLFKDGLTPQIPECDWSEPVNLGAPINSSAGEERFRMSSDGRIAVWSSNRPGTYGNDDIWYSYWNTKSGSWSEPHNCGPNVNNWANDEYPSLSPDSKKLYCLLFARDDDIYDWKIWTSDWDSIQNEWGPIESIGPPLCDEYAMSPFLSPTGTKLYFDIEYSIAYSDWNGTGWSEPIVLGPNVNANLFESEPTVTADNKTLYFSRYNHTAYICVSHWTGTEWSLATALGPQINDPGGTEHPYVTPDGTKLYFISARSGGFGSGDVWVSERIPITNHK